MQNITKIGKPGDIFINRAGQECIWVASDGKGKYKYRFRLLSEHKKRKKECDYFINKLYELPDAGINFIFDINKKIWPGQVTICWPETNTYETGDWYVRFNGSKMACNKWEEPLDIINKADIK